MYFEGIGAAKRTDALFKDDKYPTHCKFKTPLINLNNFNIIKGVIIAEPLHLFDFGIMRKLLSIWQFMTVGKHKKWNPQQRHQISQLIKDTKLPSEIHRKMRNLKYFGYWKASEFRSFLLYIGSAVLKNYLNNEEYQHFMLFFCAVTFLSSPVYKSYWNYAGALLNKFVLDFGPIYDKSLVSSNVHNLEHVLDDVKNFGDVTTTSAYSFENNLQVQKNLLRHGSRNLEQIVNRIAETEHLNIATENTSVKNYPMITTIGNNECIHIRSDFMLKPDERNQWFMLKDNTVVKYESAALGSQEFVIYGSQFLKQRESFVQPCSSYDLHITTADLNDLSRDCIQVDVSEVLCKLSAIKVEDNALMFTPLLHTLIK